MRMKGYGEHGDLHSFTPRISDLAGVKFLLKKGRVFFFRGSAQEVSGQCGGAKCGARTDA